MTPAQACNFLLVGTGMIAGPALWPHHFTIEHLNSATWLVFMGGLQACGGFFVLGLAGVRLSRRLAEWESLDLDLALPDVRWAMAPSLYSVLEDTDEVTVALRLRQQLLRRAA